MNHSVELSRYANFHGNPLPELQEEKLAKSTFETTAPVSLWQRISKSAIEGLKAGGKALATYAAGGGITYQIMPHWHRNSGMYGEVLVVASLLSSSILSVYIAQKTFRSLSKSDCLKNSNTAPVNSNTAPLNYEKTDDLPLSLSKTSALDKLVESLKICWKGYGVSLIPFIVAANVLDIPINKGVNLIGSSALVGTCLAIKNFIKKPSPNQDMVVSKVKTIAKSIFQGVIFGLASMGSLATAETVRIYATNDIMFGIAMASIIIPGISRVIYSLLRASEEQSTLENPATVKTLLPKIAKSLAEGALVSGAVLGTMMTSTEVIRIFNNNSFIPALSLSIAASVVNSINHYHSHIYKDAASKETRNRLENALWCGWLGSAITAFSTVFVSGCFRGNILSYPIPPEKFLAISALGGAGCALLGASKKLSFSGICDVQKQIFKKGLSLSKSAAANTSQKWKKASKIQKSAIIFTSLAALTTLGILHVGPAKVYEQGKDMYDEMYDKYAFTTSTKTVTQTQGEWIQQYSDSQEMIRLAELTKHDLDDFTCAEILQTCDAHLKSHKKAFREKSRKFHPDKISKYFIKNAKILSRYLQENDLNKLSKEQEKEIGNKVLNALTGAQKIWEKENSCPGYGDPGCLLSSPNKDDELFNLLKVADKTSCAEIMQVPCEIDLIRKDITTKWNKFDPYKYQGLEKNIATQARIALTHARDIMKKEKSCPGHDSIGCLINTNNRSTTYVLKQPTWFGNKIKESSSCFLTIDNGKPFKAESLETCLKAFAEKNDEPIVENSEELDA